ncbi:MAG: flagellar biosynthesis anti-sigma factor FlgM [Armatimonadota bacterium]
MRINTGSVHANPKTAETATNTRRADVPQTREPGNDSVTVSPRARLLALARNALDAAPQIRASVVEAARARLSSGDGPCEGGEIARAMIDSISDTQTSEDAP